MKSTREESFVASGWAVVLVLGCIIVVGASVQRLAGIGFALVAVPALVLLLGPAEGVVLTNCAAGAISAVGLVGTWRQVRLAAMVPLVAAACDARKLGRGFDLEVRLRAAAVAGILPGCLSRWLT